ncbi:MAG: ATP-binding protein, partial [Polaromonas sp.]|nr:ATP-binding protein [Polaromonas sp.]
MNSPRGPLEGIVLLGAPGTGKTRLAQALGSALGDRHPPVQPRITESAIAPTIAPAPGIVTLLMGLDLPASASPAVEAADNTLRQALAASGTAYQVIYGSGPERLHNALLALQTVLGKEALPMPVSPAERTISRTAKWLWACD